MPNVEIFHVVRAFQVLVNIAFSSGSKGLNGIKFPFLHPGGFPTLYNWHRLASMDLIRCDGVAVEVPHTLHLVSLSIELHLVGLHHFLDGFTDVTQARVNAGGADASICGFPDCLQQGVKLGVERYRKRRVDDAPLDLSPKICNSCARSMAMRTYNAWCLVSGHSVHTFLVQPHT
jgi:hypothetical protein